MTQKYLIAALVLFYFNVFGQTEFNKGLVKSCIDVFDGGLKQVKASGPFTALAFLLDQEGDLTNAHFVVNGVDFPIVIDTHMENSNGKSVAGLYTFESTGGDVLIYPGNYRGSLEVHFIDGRHPEPEKARLAEEQTRKAKNTRTELICDEPEAVSQSVWRAGLPSPSSSKSVTNVTHLIIHHSAGTNTSSNWTEVVRSIYTYHTQTNGWSDIGYNYLIAPNGTLFKGRDPMGKGAQDEILGAHFCGKNGNTMGTCLLGTYSSVSPTEASLSTLRILLGWKTSKDGIDPTGSTAHYGSVIKNISGHRDGCATECPGNMTYSLLPTLRTDIKNYIGSCGEEPLSTLEFSQLNIYPNPVNSGMMKISGNIEHAITLEISDISGRPIHYEELSSLKGELVLSTEYWPKGNYLVRISGNGNSTTRKVIIWK